MRYGKLIMSVLATTLILTACSEPKKYEYTNGEMGEKTVAKSPRESAEAFSGSREEVIQEKEIFLSNQAKITEPIDGLTLGETKALYTVTTLYTYLENQFFDGVDNLVLPEGLEDKSFTDFYKLTLGDKGRVLLNYEVQIVDELEEEKGTHKVVIETDTEYVEDSEVNSYVDKVTVVEYNGEWLINSIETKEK